MTTYPTDEAWAFFMKHHDAIRDICEELLPRDRIPLINGQQIVAPPEAKIDQFDAAVKAKDTYLLYDIMNSAWLRAPEDRGVYRIPGFSEMCGLLDFSEEGFVASNGPPEE